MDTMCFKLFHNPANKTLTLPRATLQLSGLADAEELALHTGVGFVLAARSALDTLECLHLLQFFTSTAVSLLLQLAVFSREREEDPECSSAPDAEAGVDGPGLILPACLLAQAGLGEADCLDAIAENGRVIVSEAKDKDRAKHKEDDPLREFDEDFHAILQLCGVDLDALRRQIRQEAENA